MADDDSFVARPIPQWFRLKSDTKIQVRICVESVGERNSYLCSTTPSAVTGDAQSSTFKKHDFASLSSQHRRWRHSTRSRMFDLHNPHSRSARPCFAVCTHVSFSHFYIILPPMIHNAFMVSLHFVGLGVKDYENGMRNLPLCI
jgi:hypothetical protein